MNATPMISTNNQTNNQTSVLDHIASRFFYVNVLPFFSIITLSLNLSLILLTLLNKKIRSIKPHRFFLLLSTTHVLQTITNCITSYLTTDEVYRSNDLLDYFIITSQHEYKKIIVTITICSKLIPFPAMVLVTIYRYIAVEYPLRFQRMQLRTIILSIIFIEILPIAVGGALYYYTYETGEALRFGMFLYNFNTFDHHFCKCPCLLEV